MKNANLTRLAADLGADTKVAAKAALKAAGLKQTLSDDLLAERQRLQRQRTHARRERIARRLGYQPVDAAARRWSWPDKKGTPGNGVALRAPTHGTPRPPVKHGRLPRGTPAERLDALRRATVVGLLHDLYRLPADTTHGDESIILTADPAAVGVRQVHDRVWIGSDKWATNRVDTTVTVPADWRLRVQRRRLANIDGMLTLDAAPMDGAPAGVELFAAVWLVQGRGYAITAARGYIARSGSLSYHADSADAALAGLRKKIKAAEWSATLRAADLSALMARLPAGLLVRVADAKAIGACDYGIRSWCHATGLPYETGSAPIADVYAAYQREPRPEARAAMLHAARAHLRAA